MKSKKKIEQSLKRYNHSICEECEEDKCLGSNCDKIDTRSASDVLSDMADSENDSRRDDPELYEDMGE